MKKYKEQEILRIIHNDKFISAGMIHRYEKASGYVCIFLNNIFYDLSKKRYRMHVLAEEILDRYSQGLISNCTLLGYLGINGSLDEISNTLDEILEEEKKCQNKKIIRIENKQLTRWDLMEF